MSRTNQGFTLVEMLMSMAIGAVVLLVAVSSLRSTSEGYGRGTASVAAEREARATLTLAAEDLSKATLGERAIFERGEGQWRQDRLGFFCLQPDDAQSSDERIGDLCAVVYYVDDLKMGGDTVRCLLRGFRDSEETFAALRIGQLESLFEPSPADEPVSFGVLAFEAEPLERGAGGAWSVMTREANSSPPDAVRLKLVVARRELLGKLRTSGNWDSPRVLASTTDPTRSKYLETYEVIQPFAHEN